MFTVTSAWGILALLLCCWGLLLTPLMAAWDLSNLSNCVAVLWTSWPTRLLNLFTAGCVRTTYSTSGMWVSPSTKKSWNGKMAVERPPLITEGKILLKHSFILYLSWFWSWANGRWALHCLAPFLGAIVPFGYLGTVFTQHLRANSDHSYNIHLALCTDWKPTPHNMTVTAMELPAMK